MAPLKIALAQLASHPGDVPGNLARAASVVLRSRADVVALPELYACGYDPGAIAANPSWSLTTDELAPLAVAAAKSRTWVLLGASVTTEGRPRNAVVVIDSAGRIRGRYAKRHLWGAESKAFDEGEDLLMIEVNDVSIGVGICYDAGFPELSRAYALAGAHAVVFCSAFAFGPAEHRYRVYHPARALENTVYTLVVNAVGDVAGERYFGRSGAWSPQGQPLLTAGETENVSTVDVHPTAVSLAREELPYLADLRTGAPHVTRVH